MGEARKYVLDGVEITSKPPRERSRRGMQEGTSNDDSIIVTNEEIEGTAERDVNELAQRKHEFSYLDHPADVVIVGSGRTLSEALESIAIGMFGYLTDLTLVSVEKRRHIVVESKSLTNLLFHFLNECLYLYSGEYFIAKYVRVCNEIDLKSLLLESEPVKVQFFLYGETFDRYAHTSGTEIKAITYHEMKIELTMGKQVYTLSHSTRDNNEWQSLMRLFQSGMITAASINRVKLFTLVDI